ncbi:type IV secretion system protein [Denitromonas sp.]|uniref:virB8 family protein n=1 Tax=Denitromonas sp. TaxID=2734609 RepID=UPI002AFE96BD|nr:type IV secretion system protein [Denitromonas sp.]
MKKVKKDEFDQYLEETRGLERDYIGEVLKSRRAAWFVAGVGLMLGFLGLGAGWAGLSQDAPDPLILRVDNATGDVDVVTTMKEQETTYGEVVDAYFLNKYVLNREGYDYDTIQTLYDTTALLSNPVVQREFYALYDGQNARDKKLSNRTKIMVKVRSITPTAGGGNAVVRFTTQQRHSNGSNEPPRNWIATIGYTYVNAPISAQDRRINPLGFQVYSYRVDPESVTAN